MCESEDDFTSHRIGIVLCLVDCKSSCAQEIKEWLRMVVLSKNKNVYIIGGAWSPPDTEC